MEAQGKDKAPAQGENQEQRNAAMLESAELAEKHRLVALLCCPF